MNKFLSFLAAAVLAVACAGGSPAVTDQPGGPHLVILKELGVFDNTYTRKRQPGGGFTVSEFTVSDTQLDQLRQIIKLVYPANE